MTQKRTLLRQNSCSGGALFGNGYLRASAAACPAATSKAGLDLTTHAYGADEFATDYERNTTFGGRYIGCQSRNKWMSAFHLIEKSLGRTFEGR